MLLSGFSFSREVELMDWSDVVLLVMAAVLWLRARSMMIGQARFFGREPTEKDIMRSVTFLRGMALVMVLIWLLGR